MSSLFCILLVILLVSACLEAFHVTETLGRNDYVAEISGLDLETITDAEFDEVHQLLVQYKVLVVRNQKNFSVEGQRSFAHRFGKLHVHLESASHLPGYEDVNVVSNMVVNGSHIGLFGKHVEAFHADLSWNYLPAKVTILRSVIRPDSCGDTEFANTHQAYDELPEEVKRALAGKKGNYCYLKMREIDENGNAENLKDRELEAANKCAVHPLVTSHPITGQKNLFANPSDTSFVLNMTASESNNLLQEIFRHTENPRYNYRHQYRDDDVVLWDNRGESHPAPLSLIDIIPHSLPFSLYHYSCAPSSYWLP